MYGALITPGLQDPATWRRYTGQYAARHRLHGRALIPCRRCSVVAASRPRRISIPQASHQADGSAADQQEFSGSSTACDISDHSHDHQPQPAAATLGQPQAHQQQQQQQQRQQKKSGQRTLDVARAVQLLKLTTVRSNKKGRSKLPPWFTRTQDPDFWADPEQIANSSSDSSKLSSQPNLDSYLALADDQDIPVADTNPSQSSSSSNGITNSPAISYGNSSRGRALEALDDDYMVPPLQQATSSSSSSYSRRMFSASDPIRRHSEWHLPWQEIGAGDAAKEAERQYRRAVFSFDRWAAHRSTSRYLRHFRGIFSSRTFQGLLQPMGFFTAVALLAGLYNTYLVPRGFSDINVNDTALDITAFAVSLLLVFRTDSSYARWEEALKAWNDVRSLSKDLARQSCYWVNELARKEMLVRWCEAFSRALLVHCRVDGCLETELEDVLLPHEVAAVAAVGPSGAPSFVLQVLAELIEQCGVTEIKEDKMFSTVRALGDTVAVCNKLLRYPLPLAYTRHTSRFMFLWLSAMPWAMWAEMHWAVVPVTAAVSYLLLGIDEIGVQIEEPFGILPLEDVCVDIQAEIDAMMERQDIVTDLLVAGGVDCEPRSTCGACGAPVRASSPAATTGGTDAAGSSGSGSGPAGWPGHPRSQNGGGPSGCGAGPVGGTSSGGCNGAAAFDGSMWAADAVGPLVQQEMQLWDQERGSVGDSTGVGTATKASAASAAAAAFVEAGVGVRTVALQSGGATCNPVGLQVDPVGSSGGSGSSIEAPSTSNPLPGGGVAAAATGASRRTGTPAGGTGSGLNGSNSCSSSSSSSSNQRRPGSPQGLVARWMSNTMGSSGSGSLWDPLSSLEDVPGPEYRGMGLWLQMGPSESLEGGRSSAGDSSSNGSSGQSGRLGRYERPPAPTDDHRYPD